MYNGTQLCSYNVRKGRLGFILTPFDNIGCGVELPITLNRIIREVANIAATGKCEWKPPPKEKGVQPLAPYGEFQQCLMDELKAKLREREVAG